jgi:predicted component of type VI protein secretion system
VQLHCSTHATRITAAVRRPLKSPAAASTAPAGKGSANQPQQKQQLQPPVVTHQHEQHAQPEGATANIKQAHPAYGAARALRALCQYSPQGLSDGPASLSKVGCPSRACSWHLIRITSQ